MEYVREERERIREVKMLQILKRALTLDARSKIKPTLKNPSLLRMSELRGSAVPTPEQFEADQLAQREEMRKNVEDYQKRQNADKLAQYKQFEANALAQQEQIRKLNEDYQKRQASMSIFGGGFTEDIKKSADLFAKAQEQRQNEFNKSLLEAAAQATAAQHPELAK